MISDVRKHLKTPFFRFFLFALALSFALVYIIPFTQRGSGMPWAVRVGEQEIGYKEYLREVRLQEQYISAFRAQYGRYADMLLESFGMAADPRMTAYRLLVNQALFDQAAVRAGIHLHADYVAQQLSDPNFLSRELATVVPPYVISASGTIDRAILAEYLKNKGLSIAEFEEQVDKVLARKVVEDILATTVYVPDFEQRLRYRVDNGRKKFSVVTIDFDRVLANEKKTEISKEELREYFSAEGKKRSSYWVPEKRGATLWRFTPQSYGISINDEEIESYYQDNKQSEFQKAPAKMEVRRILLKVSNPENEGDVREQAVAIRQQVVADPGSFARVAKERSADADSAAKGGLLAPFARKEPGVDQIFARTAFLLKEDGAISEVVKTAAGYEILQRVRRMDAEYEPLGQVKAKIRQKLANRAFKRDFARDMGEIIRAGEIDQERFQELARTSAAKPEEIAPMAKEDSKLALQLFRLDEGEMGFYVDGDAGIVVKLTSRQERYLPTLEVLRPTVLADMYEERARKQVQTSIKAARKALAAGMPEKLAEIPGATLEETGWVPPRDSSQLQALRAKGVPVQALMSLENVGLLMTHQGDRDGFVIRLDELDAPDPQLLDAQRAEIERTLRGELTDATTGAFVASLRRNATIEVNESIAVSRQ